MQGFLCMDCGKDTNRSQKYYMLKYKLWRAIHYKIDGMLCLACAEHRLGRPLVRDDFSRAPVNEGQARVCPELALQLARVPQP